MLYLASQRIVRHWHTRCQNWDMFLSQLEVMLPERNSLPLLFPTGRWERGRQGMSVELRHQLSTILDFVELRIHKIFWSTQMLRTIGQLTLERDFLQDCFRAAGRPIPKLSSDDQ